MDSKSIATVAKSIRSLSIDAIQKANSGHPGLPLGCAELAALLYGEILKHNPADSKWADRDRFVLSAGHGSMLLYSILHLSGYKITLDDIKISVRLAQFAADILNTESQTALRTLQARSVRESRSLWEWLLQSQCSPQNTTQKIIKSLTITLTLLLARAALRKAFQARLLLSPATTSSES